MAVIDLKQGGLEKTLAGVDISEEKRAEIIRDINHYDEYYLTSLGRIVKIFRQEFVKDPYMKLGPIPELRLVLYDSAIVSDELSELLEVFDKENIPIITRRKEKVISPDFNDISNYKNSATVLIPIVIPLPQRVSELTTNIREMEQNDIDIIKDLFRNNYSLRYRFVDLLYKEGPQVCFVYEDKGKILGVTFNRIENDELFMRQIFVCEGYRGRGIGNALYKRVLGYARQRGVKAVKGNIRGESIGFHYKFYAKIDENKEMEYYITRGIK